MAGQDFSEPDAGKGLGMQTYQVIVCLKDHSHRCIAVRASESDPAEAIEVAMERIRKEGGGFSQVSDVVCCPFVFEGTEPPVVRN